MDTRADWDRITANVQQMKAASAPATDIDRYLASEGVMSKFDAWRRPLSSRRASGVPNAQEAAAIRSQYSLA